MKSPLTDSLTATHLPGQEPCFDPHTIPTMLQKYDVSGKFPFTARLKACHPTYLLVWCSLRQKGYNVGMVINLSIYKDLYASDMEACRLQMCHVPVDSKTLPSSEAVGQAIEHANRFWKVSPESYIVIHCAYGTAQITSTGLLSPCAESLWLHEWHSKWGIRMMRVITAQVLILCRTTGYNRTGFVICCYLIEVCGLSVDAALASFAHSRPQGIKHEVFLAELQARYKCLPPAPIPTFNCADVYSDFYCGVSAGRAQIRELHAAAGWAQGTWAGHVVGGTCLQPEGTESAPEGGSARTAAAPTNDSHVEGLLG